MAIVKMKKLRLIAPRDRKDELLKELARLGCLEISEPSGELQGEELAPLLRRENSALAEHKARQTALLNALAVLDRQAPEKKPLLSAKPLAEADALLGGGGEEPMAAANTLLALGDRLKRLSAEESRQRSAIEALKPWENLTLPLETVETETCAVLLGSVPARMDAQEMEARLAEAAEEAELFTVSEDKSTRYLLLVSRKEELSKAQEALRPFGFAPAALSGLRGTAAANIVSAEARLEELDAEKEQVAEDIAAMKDVRSALQLAADAESTEIARAEAEDKLCGTESALVLQGWMPAAREEELGKLFDSLGCAWESEDPDPSEYPDVPVQLKNNKVTDGLNMVTEMYSLPAYDGVDPNPLMAPFFILFYGLMMADMGYGLIMILAALVAMAKIKPKEGSLSFCRLLLWGGISTLVMGALTGGFFGNALEQIGKILGKPEGWGVLPSLFNPMKDSMVVLIGSMALGLIHLNTGMVISAVEKIKAGDAASALWEEGSLWVTLVGIVLFALNKTVAPAVPALLGKIVLIVGGVMILYGGTRGAKGFGKLTSIFGTLYNTLTGWFGDILSYSRIMALMLAGSVIATVFNTIGSIANSFALFIPIFIIGHGLNFALNLLGCYVHDLRLQCLEYFGKFYKDGGRAFAPLRIKTKYYDVIE